MKITYVNLWYDSKMANHVANSPSSSNWLAGNSVFKNVTWAHLVPSSLFWTLRKKVSFFPNNMIAVTNWFQYNEEHNIPIVYVGADPTY